MEGLKWPVDNCECGFDLTAAAPKAKDKAFSDDGSRKPRWCDYCSKCGRGHIVGERQVPNVPEQLTPVQIAQALHPPEQETEEPGPTGPAPSEPDAVKAPGKGQYFCTKCAANHNETSKVGKRHTKNREA